MTIQIVEIVHPAVQGRSGPYVCRGEDGSTYFVKGRNTGRRSQIIEWVCAHLARALGLPVATFELVEIVPELLAETPKSMREVGAGLAFGSREYPQALWFELDRVNKTDIQLQRDILVFDWWVHNMDRLSTNPNLLWDATHEKLVVIDHNLAFDPDFVSREFLDYHIFRSQADRIFDDMVDRANYQDRLLNALEVWNVAISSIPETWWWVDDECTVAADFDVQAARSLLQRCESSDFWGVA